jgi:hypothetical protein
MEWQFCSKQLTNNSGYSGEAIVYNSLGQSIYHGTAANGISLESIAQPRWVKTPKKIYPISWCCKD